MIAPTDKTSMSARSIGDRVHSDILLKNKSIGGNTVILVTSDEKSLFLVGVPCVTKGEKAIQRRRDSYP